MTVQAPLGLSVHSSWQSVADAVEQFGHLPVKQIRWADTLATFELVFVSCDAYEAAQGIAGGRKVPPRSSSRSDHRIYDHVTPGGPVLVHHCFPHLPCWKDIP